MEGDNNDNPYSLPSDGQLLAYWHYQKSLSKRMKDPKCKWDLLVPTPSEPEQYDCRKRFGRDDPRKELRECGGSTSFSATRYIRDIRELSKWRLVVGRKRDGCLQLDQQHDIQLQKYVEMKREYRACVSALESYLAYDHDTSMRALNAAQAELKLTTELGERRDELSRRYGQTRLQLYHWEESWRAVQACRNFLRHVSPLGLDEDFSAAVECLADSDDFPADSRADGIELRSFVKSPKPIPSASDIVHSNSLESIIASFEKEMLALDARSANLRTPEDLGFKRPADLLRIFRDTELRNLNALIHLESLGGPMADMIARIDIAEMRVKSEIEDVLEGIKYLELTIEREERRATSLERQSGQLVQRQFRALVSSPEALQARILVEEAYESCVAANEAGLDGLAMARGLEAAYEKLSVELDSLPRHLVLACERDGFQQEMKENREIEEAAKKFELMQRLLAALRRLMEPTQPKHRKLMHRSMSKIQRTSARQSPTSRQKRNRSAQARDILHRDFFRKPCKPKKHDEDSSDED